MTANYVSVGHWWRCAHCGTANTGPMMGHFCGAPWQSPESEAVGGETCPAEWVAAIRAAALNHPSAGGPPQ